MRSSLTALAFALAAGTAAATGTSSCVGVTPAVGGAPTVCDVPGESTLIPVPAGAGFIGFQAVGGGGGSGGVSQYSTPANGGNGAVLQGVVNIPAGTINIGIAVAQGGSVGGNSNGYGTTGGAGGGATYLAFVDASGITIADAVIAAGGGGGGSFDNPGRRLLAGADVDLTPGGRQLTFQQLLGAGGDGLTSPTDLSGKPGNTTTNGGGGNNYATGGAGGSATDPNAIAAGGNGIATGGAFFTYTVTGHPGQAHGSGWGVRAGGSTNITMSAGYTTAARAGGGGSGWAGGGAGGTVGFDYQNSVVASATGGGGGGSSWVNNNLLYGNLDAAPAQSVYGVGGAAGAGGNGMLSLSFIQGPSYGTRVTLDGLRVVLSNSTAAPDVTTIQAGTPVFAQITCSSFTPPAGSSSRRLSVSSGARHLATSIPAPPGGVLALNATVLETGEDLGELGWIYTTGDSIYQFVPFNMPAVKGSLVFTGSIAYGARPGLMAGRSQLQLQVIITFAPVSETSFVLAFFITVGVFLAAAFGCVCCCCVPVGARREDEDEDEYERRLPKYTWRRVTGQHNPWVKVN